VGSSETESAVASIKPDGQIVDRIEAIKSPWKRNELEQSVDNEIGPGRIVGEAQGIGKEAGVGLSVAQHLYARQSYS
jgi:hypothetical protein